MLGASLSLIVSYFVDTALQQQKTLLYDGHCCHGHSCFQCAIANDGFAIELYTRRNACINLNICSTSILLY